MIDFLDYLVLEKNYGF